jgi:hypothetical protein
MGYILIPVFNASEKVDLLTGLVANQHYGQKGRKNSLNCRSQKFGEAISDFTGEVFRVQEDNVKDTVQRIGTFHFNLFGNKGSHYVGTFSYDKSGELNFLRISIPDSPSEEL